MIKKNYIPISGEREWIMAVPHYIDYVMSFILFSILITVIFFIYNKWFNKMTH
ncbi:MAG: hypothetical protein ACI4XL_11115 [Bacillus sp. (in: firmicutes)]